MSNAKESESRRMGYGQIIKDLLKAVAIIVVPLLLLIAVESDYKWKAKKQK